MGRAMTMGDDELRIAGIASEHSKWALGRQLGAPVLNDDGTGDGLVDVVFPEADPPAVMEVTRVVDADHRATHAAAVRAVEGKLRTEAERIGLGSWWFFLNAGTYVKSLERDLIGLMERLDPPKGQNLRGAALPQHLRDAGLISVGLDRDGPSSADIATMSGTGPVSLVGLGPDLAAALNDNHTKLSRIGDHERHLAVWNQALRAGDPGLTPVPVLPDPIDYLWVIRTRDEPQPTAVVWVASGTWLGWKTLGEPHQ